MTLAIVPASVGFIATLPPCPGPPNAPPLTLQCSDCPSPSPRVSPLHRIEQRRPWQGSARGCDLLVVRELENGCVPLLFLPSSFLRTSRFVVPFGRQQSGPAQSAGCRVPVTPVLRSCQTPNGGESDVVTTGKAPGGGRPGSAHDAPSQKDEALALFSVARGCRRGAVRAVRRSFASGGIVHG